MMRERGAGDVAVPPTIQALLQARIDALDSDLRVVLERGAVEGEVFHRGAVQRSSRPSCVQTSTSGSAARPQGADPARVVDVPRATSAFRFRHLLIRDAAYAAMPKELRAGLHETFADWLEGSRPRRRSSWTRSSATTSSRRISIRSELGLAADPDLASAGSSEQLAAAGRGALDRGDFAAAAGLLQRAVDLPGDPDATRGVGRSRAGPRASRRARARAGGPSPRSRASGTSGRRTHRGATAAHARVAPLADRSRRERRGRASPGARDRGVSRARGRPTEALARLRQGRHVPLPARARGGR